jgi:acetyl-CoA carboxylase biotin carboxyl carrier protein
MTHDGDERTQQATLAEIADFIRTVSVCMKETGLASVEVKSNGANVRLQTGAIGSKKSAATDNGNPSTRATEDPRVVAQPTPARGHLILAPMIGTYYAASAPGEAAFVRTGDRIEQGQTVGIIEAMKILNEITADSAGIVEEILVKNAEAVEYGQPLMRILPDGD